MKTKIKPSMKDPKIQSSVSKSNADKVSSESLMSAESTHVIAAIFDNKAGIFLQPHLARSSGDFIRNVQVEAKNSQSMFNKFPSDYELFLVGDWNENDGISTTYQRRLGSVLDLCPLN